MQDAFSDLKRVIPEPQRSSGMWLQMPWETFETQ